MAAGTIALEIDAARRVSEPTVRSQIKSLYAKLGVHNAVQLAVRLADISV